MGFMYAYILAMVMLLGGNRGGTDLLDALSADMYWQIKNITPSLVQLEKDAATDAAPANFDAIVKNLAADDFPTRDKARQDLERMGPGIMPLLKPLTGSNDPEVASAAADLIRRFSERSQERVVRRLMAIRTLGERKEKDALPLLKGLADSKELFIGDYARRAIAQINGEKIEPADISAAMARDLALLPAQTALVGQSSGIGTQQLTVTTVIDKSLAMIDALPPGEGPDKKPDRKQMLLQASKQILTLAEHVGDIRLDGVSVGMNYRKADEAWFAVILRGKYDSALVFAALKDSIGGAAKDAPAAKPGDIPTISQPGDDFMMLLPNDEQLVIISGSGEKNAATRDAFVAALKAGKGTFDDNKEMAALLKTIDTKAPLWMAANLTDAMATDTFAGFKTITLDSKPIKDGIAYTFKADGPDEKEFKGSVEKMDATVKEGQGEMQKQAQTNAAAKPMSDALTSIKIALDGKHATLTGELKSEILYSLVGEMGMLSELIPEEPMPLVPPEPAVGK